MLIEAPVALSYGGGVNSQALAIELTNRGIRLDVITFADTGDEKPETYDNIWSFNEWLLSHGQVGITICRKRSMYESLEDNCLRKAMLPSRAHGYSSCADKWKIQPQEYFFNHWAPARTAWAAGLKVVKFIGYDADEVRRAKMDFDEKYQYRYPLIEWGWGREECVAAIQRTGLYVPIKSACFYCPSSTKREILWLHKEHPDLFARAVAMEQKALPNLRTVKGLGRRFSWEEFVRSTEPAKFPDPEPAPCGCYDGGDEDE